MNFNFKLLLRRFLAFVIDWNILFDVALLLILFGPGSNPAYLITPSIYMFTSAGSLLGIAWIFLYGLGKDCLLKGRSIGKLICGLEVRNSQTGEKASFGSLILRNITFEAIQIEGIVVLVNKGNRLGDIIAKTEVVKCKKK